MVKYAIIDIETTGGSAYNSKITEIAVFVHDGNKIIDEFSTLINPETYIPQYITQLTGITNPMVANAPKFYQVARKIVEITTDCIFVGHNVSFDYTFVKEEFKRLGYDYQRKTLDTVRISRKLLPGHKSYSLGNICENLQIQINGRHRAGGDAYATVKLFEILLSKTGFQQFANPDAYKFLKGITNQNHIEIINNLPDKTGVYYLYNVNKQLIYIGKSVSVKSRVAQHLRATTKNKAEKMAQNIDNVQYVITGSPLVALLLEDNEIRKHKPVFNKAQTKTLGNYGIFAWYDFNGYINLKAERANKNSGTPVCKFESYNNAVEYLHKIADKYTLCQKLCDLYNSENACFNYNIKKCFGACIGIEPPQQYNVRVQKAIDGHNFEHKNFFIIDVGRTPDEYAVIAVENGAYKGFGYTTNNNINNVDSLKTSITSYTNNIATFNIISNYIVQNKNLHIISY